MLRNYYLCVFILAGLLMAASTVSAAEGKPLPQEPGGWSYEYEKALQRKNCAKVRFYLEKGKDEGDRDAFYSDSVRTRYGDCRPKSIKKALALYQKAALMEDFSAYMALGQLYHEGRIVKKNDEEAGRWFRRATIIAINRPPVTRLPFRYLGVIKSCAGFLQPFGAPHQRRLGLIKYLLMMCQEPLRATLDVLGERHPGIMHPFLARRGAVGIFEIGIIMVADPDPVPFRFLQLPVIGGNHVGAFVDLFQQAGQIRTGQQIALQIIHAAKGRLSFFRIERIHIRKKTSTITNSP